MDLGKLFNDLESNQTKESEEAKNKLVECFSQNKEQWLVHSMMDYYLKSGSLRIGEVLIKVQTPHDTHIFDRLHEWLKTPTHRFPAINLFSFVVKRHPTWLHKVDRHRLLKDLFRLMVMEKDIVFLMHALLCIITLLPIIPSSVPNFFNDLFEVFGHLASWNCQNPNCLADYKLVHLQLGTQMLFHRLYGMFPNNFMIYINEFITKDQKGAIYQHTIKPLLETVCLHPLLITANASLELDNIRWKDMEPHDVDVECASVTLPVLHHDLQFETSSYNMQSVYVPSAPETPKITFHSPLPQMMVSQHYQTVTWSESPACSSSRSRNESSRQRNWDQSTYDQRIPIWSPYDDFPNNSAHLTLTPTPSYILPVATSNASSVTHQLMGVASGSSPPEAAVEATPETTPMKDVLKDIRQGPSNTLGGAGLVSNPNAVRAIFASSQPSSPLRKDHNHFRFPEATNVKEAPGTEAVSITEQQQISTRFNYTTNCDKGFQKIMEERITSQNTFQTIEAQAQAVRRRSHLSPIDSVKCETPDMDSLSYKLEEFNAVSRVPTHTPTQALNQMHTKMENITKPCIGCNETDVTKCTSGGLHIATGRTLQLMLKRRNRMTSCCVSSSNNGKFNDNLQNIDNTMMSEPKIRRTKSCSSINIINFSNNHNIEKTPDDDSVWERRLQKSGKVLTMPSVRTDSACQTIEALPQNYENWLYEMLLEHKKLHRTNSNPRQILDQFVSSCVMPKHDSNYVYDQEQFQLLALQLQYERYRREIHAERNRRLLGRSRTQRILEMDCDQLRTQLKILTAANAKTTRDKNSIIKSAKEKEQQFAEELGELRMKFQHEVEQNKCLKEANENLQARLTEELGSRKDVNYELETLRGEIFNLTSELQQAQTEINNGLRCKQELARLEAEFIIMGEVQVKCQKQLEEMENLRARDDELQMAQEGFNNETKDLKQRLVEKTSKLESAKHKIIELQAQLVNYEKIITEQKCLLKTTKDEYEERFKALTKKYDVQKSVLIQMEEKIAFMFKPSPSMIHNACSPDTDRTDVASSMERNSPLSTSLPSSESLSTSLRSTELRNLQQIAENTAGKTMPTGFDDNSTRLSTEGVFVLDASSTSNSIVTTASAATSSSQQKR